ncbi:MAG: GFA family protein [Rhodospirillales bacterium]|nr:GFA family protein [Rhodospirillales bacterium]MCB9995041.1 GFA family protein [Rhodospirillales bacterium]
MPELKTGHCLCGSVKFELMLNETHAHACHCSMCRRMSGGTPVLAIPCAPDSVKIDGEKSLSWYSSSEWAERGFCNQCGTGMFYRLKDGSYFNVAVGALDDDSDITLAGHIFIDAKPDYYDFKDDCPRLTEAEFLAQFAEGS